MPPSCSGSGSGGGGKASVAPANCCCCCGAELRPRNGGTGGSFLQGRKEGEEQKLLRTEIQQKYRIV